MMDKSSASNPSQKPSVGRRVQKIPTTPRPETLTIPNLESLTLPTAGTTQPLETSVGNLYARIIEEAMAKLHRAELSEEEKGPFSTENLSEPASLSDTQAASLTASSTHDLLANTDSKEKETGSDRAERERIRVGRSVERKRVATGSEHVENMVEIVVIDSEEDEMEMRGSSRQAGMRDVERTSCPLEDIASKVIREMQEIKREMKGKPEKP